MSDPVAESLRVLTHTPATLRGLVADIAEEDLSWRPNAERWSIAMVLAHLADVEVGGFQNRFRAMLEQDAPILRRYDQLVLFRSGKTAWDAPAQLAAFQRERSRTLKMLQSMPSGATERIGRHEELGEITVAQLLAEFAFHDLGHVRQILELYRSRVFYPRMGGFQSYYEIHP